jgi:hypothetical protein
MSNKDKIYAKINALLSKTIDNGATKFEMESALLKANQLMLENFITENDLKDKSKVDSCVLIEVKLCETGFDLSYFYTNLANLFDCKYYFNKKNIWFFGYSEDAELCEYFYHVISKTCLIENELYKKSEDFKSLNKFTHGRSLSSSFIKGFMCEINSKLNTMYTDRISKTPQEYSLMVIDKKNKVEMDFCKLNKKIRTKVDTISIKDRGAFDLGKSSGQSFNIVQGIKNNSANQKLIG